MNNETEFNIEEFPEWGDFSGPEPGQVTEPRADAYVAFKNPKVAKATFGFLNEIWAFDTPEKRVGVMAFQSATTRTRPPNCGENRWWVYGVHLFRPADLEKPQVGEFTARFGTHSEVMQDVLHHIEVPGAQPAQPTRLSRYDGEDLFVAILRCVSSESELPNGDFLPSKWELVQVTLKPRLPRSRAEAQVCWGLVPFHGGGGPEATVNPFPEDLVEREIVSHCARRYPLWWAQGIREQKSLRSLVPEAAKKMRATHLLK